MDALSTAAGLCQSIIDWVEQVKALKQQCKAVRDQVETLLPLLKKYTDELRSSASGLAAHDRRWVTSLVAALTGAQDARKGGDWNTNLSLPYHPPPLSAEECDAIEAQYALDLENEERAKKGLPPLLPEGAEQ